MKLPAAIADQSGFAGNHQTDGTLPGADIDRLVIGVKNQNQCCHARDYSMSKLTGDCFNHQ